MTNMLLVTSTIAFAGSIKYIRHEVQKKLRMYFGVAFDEAVLDKNFIYDQVWTRKQGGDGKHYYIPHEKLNPKYLRIALQIYEELLDNPENIVHNEKKFKMLLNGIKVKPNESLFNNKKDEDNLFQFYCLPDEKSFRIHGSATFQIL